MILIAHLLLALCLLSVNNVVYFVESTRHNTVNGLSDEIISANFTVMYTRKIQHAKSLTFVYKDHSVMSQAVRVHVAADLATVDYPVLFVVKDQRNVLSWQVPLVIHNEYHYLNVSRTLCPMNTDVNSSQLRTSKEVDIDVSTMSPTPISIHLMAEIIDIDIGIEERKHIRVSPSQPKYLHFMFPSDQDTVVVNMRSDDDLCMVLSVQDVKCPVFDLTRNVEFIGEYQTADEQGAITVQRHWFSTPEFFIVLVVKPNDMDCQGSQPIAPVTAKLKDVLHRVKNIEITVTPDITETEFQIATISAACWFLSFYVVAFVISCGYHIRHRKENSDPVLVYSEPSEYDPLIGSNSTSPIAQQDQATYGATADQSSSDTAIPPPQPNSTGIQQRAVTSDDDDDGVVDETDVDMLYDVNHEKDVFRTKPFLYVSDLSRKTRKYLHKKYRLYPWNLIVIAIFYGLPVIQLVITYQKVLNVTGNQDLCYYNFKCARRLGVLSAFNNVYSNIGYVLLGLLFLILVYRRNRYHAKRMEQNPRFDKHYGIPQHFGLFYGMGIALAMEGVLSGSYHVCPSYTNFQFDTSFMYMIGWLCMLKIYQNRHPDINANAHTAYFVISLVIFLAVLGVLTHNPLYYWLFSLIHVITCFVMSFHVYYMGRWSADLGVFKRMYLMMRTDRLSCFRPMYMDRMILLIIGNLVNWSFAIYGIIEEPRDFASYLLAIFIVNLLMYFAFYIIMKLRSRERILVQPIIYTIVTAVIWVGALYLFVQHDTSFGLTPAKSRRLNRECMLLDFFDEHDVWHFMSSMALFFGFMILLTLDDDLAQTPRDKIPVF